MFEIISVFLKTFAMNFQFYAYNYHAKGLKAFKAMQTKFSGSMSLYWAYSICQSIIQYSQEQNLALQTLRDFSWQINLLWQRVEQLKVGEKQIAFKGDTELPDICAAGGGDKTQMS